MDEPAWQITVPPGVDLTDDAVDIHDVVELRRLDFDEMMVIELFAMCTWTSQSGLPSSEDNCTDPFSKWSVLNKSPSTLYEYPLCKGIVWICKWTKSRQQSGREGL